ncbi:MAG: hypothetical protein WAO09_02600 [Candidatus Dormiibacterota bacterium]
MAQPLAVGVEVGQRRTFAWVVEWPGWCRSGRGETAALAALADYRARYLPIAEAAGESLGTGSGEGFAVTERAPGSMTTDFGSPGAIAAADGLALSSEDRRRYTALLVAAWDYFDQVVGDAPADLRKGPRGGGRDRDRIVEHVLEADLLYARKLGIKLSASTADRSAVTGLRTAVSRTLAQPDFSPPGAKGWPPRYYVRRAAWHLLDHAWEIQDRSS